MDQDQAPQTRRPITLVLVDDLPVVRRGLRAIFAVEDDIEVVAEGHSGELALELVRRLQPDVVLLDINLPDINGLEVIIQLKTDHATTGIVLLTSYDDMQQVQHVMRSGGAACCPKNIEPEALVDVVRKVAQGAYVVGHQIFDQNGLHAWLDAHVEAVTGSQTVGSAEHFAPLSRREMEILRCVTQGMSNKEIAQLLGISHQTVKNYMTSILRKLDARDRTQAAVYALRKGWVTATDRRDDAAGYDE